MMRLTSAPLVSFLEALDLDPVANETPSTLLISEIVSGQAIIDLSYDIVEPLVEAYGRSITAEILLGDLPELTIVPDITSQILHSAKANVLVDNQYELRLRIEKQALLDEVLGVESARDSVLYFFASSVESTLHQGLDRLELAIWDNKTGPRRLLVGDTDLQRSGPLFQVIGGCHLTGSLPPVALVPDSIAAYVNRMRTDRVEHISWDYQWVQQLTPIQVQLDDEAGDSHVEELLAAAYVQLSLLYTCDRARRQPSSSDGWESHLEYQGGQLSVRVRLPEAQPIGTQITAAAVRGFAGLLDWCYRLRDEGSTSDWAADRLQFAQVRIALLLQPEPEANRLTTLVRQISDVLEALDDQWRSFIEDRFSQYLDQERQLETSVNDVVATFGEKATALTKDLSDTLLAAVAVLIGSAIAAAFNTPFNSELFRVGVLTYAGYVLVFPGLFGLGSQVGQFLEIGKAFEHERGRFNTLIGARKTHTIIGERVDRAKARYRRWLVFTIVGYLVAIAGAILAAIEVPGIVT